MFQIMPYQLSIRSKNNSSCNIRKVFVLSVVCVIKYPCITSRKHVCYQSLVAYLQDAVLELMGNRQHVTPL